MKLIVVCVYCTFKHPNWTNWTNEHISKYFRFVISKTCSFKTINSLHMNVEVNLFQLRRVFQANIRNSRIDGQSLWLSVSSQIQFFFYSFSDHCYYVCLLRLKQGIQKKVNNSAEDKEMLRKKDYFWYQKSHYFSLFNPNRNFTANLK